MTSDTVRLHYRTEGPRTEGPPDAPVVFLGGSLGTTLAMWGDLVESLTDRYRVVRFDTRGHGSSPIPPGPYTMRELAADVVALADDLDIDRFAYVGLSLGGAIGQTLAVEHPDRLTSLVLCCTAPKFGDPAAWRERSARVTAEGMAWLVEITNERWFPPSFIASHPERVKDILDMLATTSPVGYAACCDAIASYDLRHRIGEIDIPTRVIAGGQDLVTPPEVTQFLAEGIRGADHVVIAEAAHIANVARPEQFNATVVEHLDRTTRI